MMLLLRLARFLSGDEGEEFFPDGIGQVGSVFFVIFELFDSACCLLFSTNFTWLLVVSDKRGCLREGDSEGVLCCLPFVFLVLGVLLLFLLTDSVFSTCVLLRRDARVRKKEFSNVIQKYQNF